jgi:hypothetical protein
MAKERQARLLYAIGFVLMAAVAPTAFNRAAQAANTSPQAAAPAVSGPAAANPSPSSRLNAPEEPTARTVEALSQICRAGKEGQMWCGAYLIGVADTMTAFGKGGHKAGICGISYDIERLQQVFTTWAQQHPELQELDMLAGANLAFREAWPCA